MFLRQILDPYLAQYAYLVGCQKTGEALIIDPERDIDRYEQLARENELRITAVAETHIHADFVSGAREFAQGPDIRIYLSAEGGPDWTYRWPGDRPNTHPLRHGDRFHVGRIEIEAVHTPGHTPEHLGFLITDRGSVAEEPIAMATGDFVFVGDVGRPDLLESAIGMAGAMEPAARQLRESLKNRLAHFGDYLQLLPAHGAGSSCGKSLGAVPTTTLGYERRTNRALQLALEDAEKFVANILTGQPEPPLYFARMKRLNRDGARTGGPAAPPELDASAFAERMAKADTRIVDAREDRIAFDAAHVAGSLHAPLRSPLFTAGVGSFLSETDAILLVLGKPDDLDLARRQLYRIGFDRLAGWIAASNAGDLMTSAIPRIDFAGLEQSPPDGVILDVRSSAEFHGDHLEGARSFPYTRLKTRLHELPKNERLLVHCGAGRRSAMAASFLSAQGFDVVHVNGGRAKWR